MAQGRLWKGLGVPEFRLACYALVRNRRGEVLLLQRAEAEGQGMGGRWELPGGKMDPGETVAEAVCREVREESGLEIELGGLAGAVDFPIRTFRVIMLVLEAAAAGDVVTLSPEHQAWRWMRLEEIAGLDLIDHVRHFLEEYQAKGVRRPA